MVIFPFGFYILQGKRTIYGQPPRLERAETVRAYGAYRGASTARGPTALCGPLGTISTLRHRSGRVDHPLDPVENLTFSADFNWTHLDQKMAGTFAYGGAGAIAKPAAVYELKDQDSLTLLLRAQRNW